jgi:hypothetical protein
LAAEWTDSDRPALHGDFGIVDFKMFHALMGWNKVQSACNVATGAGLSQISLASFQAFPDAGRGALANND